MSDKNDVMALKNELLPLLIKPYSGYELRETLQADIGFFDMVREGF